jgi:hypothetical protein
LQESEIIVVSSKIFIYLQKLNAIKMHKIQIEFNSVKIAANDRLKFSPDKKLKAESILKCLNFATEMAYGNGHHKSQSFGGKSHERNSSEIFINTFQGKIAELAVYNQLSNLKIKPDKNPEFEIWGKGKWEDCDFTLKNETLRCSVKSTKDFGNLLLLEKEKYNEKGEFLETEDLKPRHYDFTFLVRVAGIKDNDPKSYMQKNSIETEVVGFLSHQNFLEVIAQNQFIKKGIRLGIPLIVDNYYVFAKDLELIKNLEI